MHVAKQLRDAVLSRLTNLSTTGANVFTDRPEVRSLQDSELPALLIYQGSEDTTEQGVSGNLQQRIQNLRIAMRVKGANGDDTMDQIRLEVEVALASPITVGVRSMYLAYSGMSDPEIDAEQEKPVIGADLNYSAEMYTNADAPDVLI